MYAFVTQRLLFAVFRVRIAARAEFNPQGCPREIELLPEKTFEVTAVTVADGLQAVAVHHNHRRIHAALVRVAHLRTDAAVAGRLLNAHGFKQRSRQFRGREFRKRRLMRVHHRLHEMVQSVTL